MKNILIIIGMTVTLGFSAMWVTGEVSVQIDKKNREEAKSSQVVDQTERYIGSAMGSMRKRQNRAITGGLVGAGIGFIGGIFIVLRSDRKAKLNQSTPQS